MPEFMGEMISQALASVDVQVYVYDYPWLMVIGPSELLACTSTVGAANT